MAVSRSRSPSLDGHIYEPPFNRATNRVRTPEQRLMCVVLEDALGVLWLTRKLPQEAPDPRRLLGESYNARQCRIRLRRQWDARQETIIWFRCTDRTYVFAFETICDALDFNAYDIRTTLSRNNWAPSTPPFEVVGAPWLTRV